MVIIKCDLCGKTTGQDDIRYIDFYKIKEEVRAMKHPQLEICAICMERIHTVIMGIDYATDCHSK